MEPISLIIGLIKHNIKDLHIVTCPTGGLAVDFLIASNLVKTIETAQVSLGEFGMAPAFRSAVEKGLVKPMDAS